MFLNAYLRINNISSTLVCWRMVTPVGRWESMCLTFVVDGWSGFGEESWKIKPVKLISIFISTVGHTGSPQFIRELELIMCPLIINDFGVKGMSRYLGPMSRIPLCGNKSLNPWGLDYPLWDVVYVRYKELFKIYRFWKEIIVVYFKFTLKKCRSNIFKGHARYFLMLVNFYPLLVFL